MQSPVQELNAHQRNFLELNGTADEPVSEMQVNFTVADSFSRGRTVGAVGFKLGYQFGIGLGPCPKTRRILLGNLSALLMLWRSPHGAEFSRTEQKVVLSLGNPVLACSMAGSLFLISRIVILLANSLTDAGPAFMFFDKFYALFSGVRFFRILGLPMGGCGSPKISLKFGMT
jgi:hypothetical protein